jgi:SAM-dependent methyltransferase
MIRLNLGCSDAIHPDFLGVDIWTPPWATPENFRKADLRKKWPFEDSSVDEIRAHDIFEHLPSKVHTMNEAHRILKPGGILDLFIPTTDGRGAFQDPTHVSFWTPNDLFYFCDYYAEWIRFHEAYGIEARFRVEGTKEGQPNIANAMIDQGHREWPGKVWKLKIRLEAVKNV